MVKPYWLRRNLSYSKDFFSVKELLRRVNLNTVCEEAACPNIGECWSRREATFLILGKNCTRNCSFCNVNPHTNAIGVGVNYNPPDPVDEEEPLRIAQAVKLLQLDYVTITSVTRDDLLDGGTEHFIKAIEAIKSISPSTIVEVLIPDMNGNKELIERLAVSEAEVIGHNIEMVERLYHLVRPQADYRRSLHVLRILGKYSEILTKSAIMVGLGENWDEIIVTLRNLRDAGVDIVHIGQYLRPTIRHFAVSKYYTPQEFEDIGWTAGDLGFKAVSSGPLVRSSYRARDSYFSANSPHSALRAPLPRGERSKVRGHLNGVKYAGCNVL